jgi:flagellin-like protein
MQLQTRSTDDRAVSPVIGAVLLIAVTVILVATSGALLMNMSEEPEVTRPDMSFDFEYGTENGDEVLDIVHEGGDKLTTGQVEVIVEDATYTGSDDPNGRYTAEQLGISDPEIKAGNDIRVKDECLFDGAGGCTAPETSDELDLSGAYVKVVWTSENGEKSFILGRWRGPEN